MKTLSVIFFVLFFSVQPVSGQDTINRAPHGGMLKQFNSWQVELVDCYEYVEVYVYDAAMEPLFNYGFTGTVQFCYSDDTCLTSPTRLYSIDGFSAEVKRHCFLHCTVKLYKDGVKINGEFNGFKSQNEDCIISRGIQVDVRSGVNSHE
ncbi:MAG: hypothetical protein ACXVPQ_01085 [Bacteroidia bacterium]